MSLLQLAAESGGEEGINPYLVGVLVLVAFLILLFILLSFGKGRDHS